MAQSFASSASLLVGLQLGSRLFTFGLNQSLLRFISPGAFGIAAIQFELLSSTILFLSREGFRNALIRAWSEKKPEDVGISNLTLIPTIIGIPVAGLGSLVYRASCSKETASQPYFNIAVIIYALASCLELASEPLHIRTMGELRTGLRVRSEGTGIVLKTAVTFLVMLFSHRGGVKDKYALTAFALGQFTYALTLFVVYTRHYGFNALKFMRQPGPIEKSLNSQYLRLSMSMTTQSIFKHLLTEGDKFLVSQISALEDQGGYALASNYGSLVARILFQPVEEMSRVYFSRTLASIGAEDETQMSSVTGSTGKHAEKQAQADRASLCGTAQVLSSIVAAQTGASFILCSFGRPFLPLVLRFGLPQRYLATSAPELLQAWIWYIPILAINGVMEAFVSSVATPHDIHRQSRWMAVFSVIFVVATGTFYRLGLEDVSLIYSNIVNLISRILFSAHFISKYYSKKGGVGLFRWTSVWPRWTFISLVVLCGSMLQALAVIRMDDLKRDSRLDSSSLKAIFVHLGSGAGLAIVSVGVWWLQTGRKLVMPGRGGV